MEHVAREPPAGALHVADVLGERSEAGILGPEAPTDPARRIPPPVEQRGAYQTAQALADRLAGHPHVGKTIGQRLSGLVRSALFSGWGYPSTRPDLTTPLTHPPIVL